MDITVSSLLPIIQASTTPVILISGMGLLLLTMTNRMGRIIDRTRGYVRELREATSPKERQKLEIQLELTWRRAKVVRLALTFATTSMLLAAALIVVIFVGTIAHANIGELMLVLFAAAILSVVAALFMFLRDIFMSLAALQLEVQQSREN